MKEISSSHEGEKGGRLRGCEMNNGGTRQKERKGMVPYAPPQEHPKPLTKAPLGKLSLPLAL